MNRFDSASRKLRRAYWIADNLPGPKGPGLHYKISRTSEPRNG
jgi:hypothetical protein